MSWTLTWGSDATRTLGALLTIALYSFMCALVWRAWRLRRRKAQLASANLAPLAGASESWLVGYASQTGTAEELAWQTARALHAAGKPARVCPLSDLDIDALASTERAVFIVSTYGEGDPPDNAAALASLIQGNSPLPALPALRFAVLALGDREYKHFCGFGRTLDGWLRQAGATPLFDRIDVDNNDAGALQNWQRELEQIGIAVDAADWVGPSFEPWELMSRRLLNAGSVGGPTFEIRLRCIHGQATWSAGDLVQVLAPAAPDRAREYSIASLPSEGSLCLLVRQERHQDGKLGVASGWLTESAEIGAEIQVRLRPNRSFQLGENAGRPLVLIGNGTGLAGLRAHLAARAEAQPPAPSKNWLVFGERNVAHDFYWAEDIGRWREQGFLDRVDLGFSRDCAKRIYVQDLLRQQADTLRAWLDAGAAIYICGSLEGMAAGVHSALTHIIGNDAMKRLAAEGRYRRDIY
jgi:sulfite reductase (NADPH) flavoprotein alpha-component